MYHVIVSLNLFKSRSSKSIRWPNNLIMDAKRRKMEERSDKWLIKERTIAGSFLYRISLSKNASLVEEAKNQPKSFNIHVDVLHWNMENYALSSSE
ncbi:hypothetical protein Sjap_026285 [Stephania japonica]|uniref:Uncharacterized protein n=1 Tax=Stephania japonica TaxID=461633 RepID=A0AAP0HGB7_9MAGN